MSGPYRPIGPDPTPEVLFIGSLLFADAELVRPVVALVDTTDLDNAHLRPILDVIRRLVEAGRPHEGTAVGDELQRTGQLAGEPGRLTLRLLGDAITSGAAANTLAPRMYAAAVVADAYRRRYESAGGALTEAAATLAEDDLLPFLRDIGTATVKHADRLAALREVA
ncbi:MAG: hypothetical protein GXY65_00220 [Rhodococcus sp.]|uniref:hypothetical protein n=1 Tax=Rhodococcus sp. TaxID=1831 RepID=UPI00168E3E7C|nr:hypothetical protein [Rhodococcus sp. (in: high G+C Gram-positive bacteria)]NLV77775.1 hypothetical protein [Rhodococcus sp. (in: high G+C Gram-positive bacteria)]